MKDLRKIWEQQKEFNCNLLNYDELTDEERVQWSKNYALYISKEVGEFLDEMPITWKVHRGKSGNQKNFIKSNALEEWIDIFKYWLCMGLVWDFTPEEFVDEYFRKSKVVDQRFKQERQVDLAGDDLKIAGVDIDGVLADYPKSFVDFINKTLGTNYDSTKVTSYDIYADLGIPTEQGMFLKDLYRQTGQKRYIGALAGARETLHWLKDNGYTVVLLTARPYKEYKRIFADTLEWLETNDMPFDCIIWDEKKEERLVKEFGIDKIKFFVDDVAGNIAGISKLGVKCYLVNKPYNENAGVNSNVTRVDSIREVIEHESTDNQD